MCFSFTVTHNTPLTLDLSLLLHDHNKTHYFRCTYTQRVAALYTYITLTTHFSASAVLPSILSYPSALHAVLMTNFRPGLAFFPLHTTLRSRWYVSTLFSRRLSYPPAHYVLSAWLPFSSVRQYAHVTTSTHSQAGPSLSFCARQEAHAGMFT